LDGQDAILSSSGLWESEIELEAFVIVIRKILDIGFKDVGEYGITTVPSASVKKDAEKAQYTPTREPPVSSHLCGGKGQVT
jgi:hypothetical protein